MREGELLMIQSLHSRSGAETTIRYSFSGVVLSTDLAGLSRGDRFQGRFACTTGILAADASDSLREDENGFLALVIGRYRLSSAGPIRLQRLITPQFYRIAIRCDRFAQAADGIGRVNLAFYSDPRYCTGTDFRLDALEIDKIPMPSLYLEAHAGNPVVNAKLQMLEREPATAQSSPG